MDEIIEEELSHLIKTLEETNGEPVDTSSLFNIPVLNAFWRILAGQRIEPGNLNLTARISKVENVIANFGSTFAFLSCMSPTLLKVFETLGFISLTKNINSIFELIDQVIAIHEATFEAGNLRDFVDCFLVQI
jgi:hypothetical protein